MEMIRPSAVAGLFYPAKSHQLLKVLEQDITFSKAPASNQPKALIVPHAGYIYSGEVAASAYKVLTNLRHKINRVVILGPSHRLPFKGLALTETDWFETPLGLIQVDRKTNSSLMSLPEVQVLEQAHAHEHSIEVQLPFLQYLLDNFKIVPIVIGHTQPELICQVMEFIGSDEETLFIISSDLSHYLDYRSAQEVDQETSEAILKLDPAPIDSYHACGCLGVKGLLLYAKKHQLQGQILDLRNSGDTAGKKDSVVGYGAYLFN